MARIGACLARVSNEQPASNRSALENLPDKQAIRRGRAEQATMKAWMRVTIAAIVAHAAIAMEGMEGMGGKPGSWSKVKVSHELKDLLVNALTRGSDNYASDVEQRVCVKQLKYLEQQVVSGMNYRFHVMGCDVGGENERAGNCTGDDANCAASSYVIRVYEQSWTDTLQVTSIQQEGVRPKKSSEVTDEEKDMIDMWIKSNKLNRFGDKKGTFYTGGTPLFNESTGESTDRYIYIINKHPDHPWLPVQEEMEGMVKAAPLSMSAKEKQLLAHERGASDTYIMGLALFGVFSILVGLVAFLKTRRSAARRFTYASVSRNDTL